MKKLTVLLLAAILLTACVANVFQADKSPAPKWTGYDGQADLYRYSANLNLSFPTSSEYTTQYEVARIEILGGEFLVDKAVNLVVKDENGREYDYENVRLKPGIYIFRKIDVTKPWGFYLNNPQNPYVNANIMFARPAK